MNFYNETEKALVLKEWDNGLTASAIAEKFGRDSNGKLIRSRNSILSLVHRKHPSPARSLQAMATRRKTDSLPPLVANPVPHTAESATVANEVGGVRFVDLETSDCRWPIGMAEDGGPRFCGCQQFRGIAGHAAFGRSSYCLEHYRQSINPHYRAAFEKAFEADKRARRRP